MHTHMLDKVTLPPALSGAAGKAWAVDLDAAYARAGKSHRRGAEVASWLVEAAWAHPIWHSYWICLVHLRPMPDWREAKFYLEGATHELWLFALDPEGKRQEMVETGVMLAMWPKNFAAQFIAESDAAAMQRVEQAVEAVCQGVLSPDTDFRSAWAALFGDNMLRR